MTNNLHDFNALIAQIDARLAVKRGSGVEAAADAFELAGALDLLKLFIASGNTRNLEDGLNRLERVFARRGRTDKDWAKGTLARLRTLGENISRSGIDHSLDTGITPPLRVSDSSQITHAETCDLLVVAALFDPELNAFLKCLSNVKQIVGAADSELPSVTYYRGLLEISHEQTSSRSLSVVAVFQDRMGMVDCAVLVTRALRVFRPALVAMTGVCAGRSKAGVKLCDLVVPSQIFTYDTGKQTEVGFHAEPLWVEASERIWRRVTATGERILEELSTEIERVYPDDLYRPKLHTQVMACGSAVIDHKDTIKRVAEANRKVVGLDMESYAVLRAVRLCSPMTPAFVVKGVMDLGTNKQDRVKRKAAFWAASFLARFIAQEYESIRIA